MKGKREREGEKEGKKREGSLKEEIDIKFPTEFIKNSYLYKFVFSQFPVFFSYTSNRLYGKEITQFLMPAVAHIRISRVRYQIF